MTTSALSQASVKAGAPGTAFAGFTEKDFRDGGHILKELLTPFLKSREATPGSDLPVSQRPLVTKGYVLTPLAQSSEESSAPQSAVESPQAEAVHTQAAEPKPGFGASQPSFTSRLGSAMQSGWEKLAAFYENLPGLRNQAEKRQATGSDQAPQAEASPESSAAPQPVNTTDAWVDLQGSQASAGDLMEFAASLGFDTRTSVTITWPREVDGMAAVPEFDGKRKLDGLAFFISTERPEYAFQILRECARPDDLIFSRNETITALECGGVVLKQNCLERSGECRPGAILGQARGELVPGKRIFVLAPPEDITSMIEQVPIRGVNSIEDKPIFPFLQIGNKTTWGDGHGGGGSNNLPFRQCQSPAAPVSPPGPLTEGQMLGIILGAACLVVGSVVAVEAATRYHSSGNPTPDQDIAMSTTTTLESVLVVASESKSAGPEVGTMVSLDSRTSASATTHAVKSSPLVSLQESASVGATKAGDQ